MIKYAIFDLDGTLLDTIDSLVKTGNIMLAELGYDPRSKEEYKIFIGYGARNLVRRLLEASGDTGASRLEEAYAAYMKQFQETCVYGVKPYPGILDLIKVMQDKDIKMSVLTNKPHEVTHKVLESSFPDGTFKFIQGNSEKFPRKPDPTAALHIAQAMGAQDMREVVFIGDSDADMQTAVNANMIAAGAVWGFRDAKELLENGCEILLNKPTDLIPYL